MGACLENGVLLAALSSLCFSLCSLVVKFLTDLHPIQLSWFSFLGSVIVSGVSVLRQKEKSFPSELQMLLVGRSAAGTVFLVSSFYSVQLISLGDASVLFYTAPAFTVILAKWLIKEPCTLKNVFLTLVTMTCVVFVLKPPIVLGSADMTKNYVFGVLMALTASLSDSLGNIALRNMRRVHFSVILFYYSLISFIFTSIILLSYSIWRSINLYDLLLILILVILNSGEQIFMILALKFEHAGTVALAQASDIIYGYAFQIIFFKEGVDVWSVLGATVITLVIILMTIDSKKQKRARLILHF